MRKKMPTERNAGRKLHRDKFKVAATSDTDARFGLMLSSKFPWISEEDQDNLRSQLSTSTLISDTDVSSFIGEHVSTESMIRIGVRSRIDTAVRIIAWVATAIQLALSSRIIIGAGSGGSSDVPNALACLSSVSFLLALLALGTRIYVPDRRPWTPMSILVYTHAFLPVLLLATLVPMLSVPFVAAITLSHMVWKGQLGGIEDKLDRSFVSVLCIIGFVAFIGSWLVGEFPEVQVVSYFLIVLIPLYAGVTFVRRRLLQT